MNWSNYKFRCSQLGKLMVDARGKDGLAETTKTYLKELYIKSAYGREKVIFSKYMEKGTEVEGQSRILATKVLGDYLGLNKEMFSNEYLLGVPDCIRLEEVVDLKSCWDIWTFASVDGTNKDYYWQLLGYMDTVGRKSSRLIYVLVDTPEHLIYKELRRLSFDNGTYEGTPEYDKLEQQVRKNLTYSDIEEKERIKVFNFEYSEEDVKKLYARIEVARDYLKSIQL